MLIHTMLLLAETMAVAAAPGTFQNLTRPELAHWLEGGAKPVASISAKDLLSANGKAVSDAGGLLILRTREGRIAKLLVQPGQQKMGAARHPMFLIERFATFKDGEERAVVTSGGGIPLYPGMMFNADLGQVVTSAVGGDLSVNTATTLNELTLSPVADAKVYLIESPSTLPKKGTGTAFEPGAAIEPRFFNGTYLLHSDGRRTGTLTLEVDEPTGEVTGAFYSDKDGRKYEVAGKIGQARHQISFSIKFPQTREQFSGYLFTGDGQALAGTTKLQDREAGFYAVRKPNK